MKSARRDPEHEPEQSSNTWINRGQPRDVSTLAPYKDGFTDILEERRSSGDLLFMTKSRESVRQYKYNERRSPAEIRQHVLASDRVNYTIELLSEGSRETAAVLRKEAEAIVAEMGHELDLTAVRGTAFFLIKVFKALFHRIYVNEQEVHKLRKLMQEYPVLLMPTHRSYMDFLLVSYICYHYDLPVPAIAAAMDFKGMKFFGWLLRHCGAFYIQRSFGSDHLYWAIFTEYVQTQLRNGDNPLEFFVEGTRSRTNKSYVPRTGMLAASLESYFKAELPDTMMVPISISYDRILEESLYAYELLGIPKPKESTSGLLKARSILEEDFGSVHIHLAEPISIRQFSSARVDRVVHSLEPRYINSLRHDETSLIRDLAYRIVRDHQRHAVISPWSLMAAILMQARDGLPVGQLVRDTDWIKRQAQNLGAYVDWPGDVAAEDVVAYNLRLHANVIAVQPDGVVVLTVTGRPAHVGRPKSDVLLDAASNLILASYRNQLLHVFLRPALVCLAVHRARQDSMGIDELYRRYSFLERLLSRDFVFQPGQTKVDFDQAVRSLKNSGALVLVDGPGQLTDVTDILCGAAALGDNVVVEVRRSNNNKHTTFYAAMFEPFLLAYWICCQHLLSLPVDRHGRPLPKRPKELARDVQRVAVRLVETGVVRHYEVLSLDIIANGLNALLDLGAMYKDRRNAETWMSPNALAVSNTAQQIGLYIELPTLPTSGDAAATGESSAVLQAKL